MLVASHAPSCCLGDVQLPLTKAQLLKQATVFAAVAVDLFNDIIL